MVIERELLAASGKTLVVDNHSKVTEAGKFLVRSRIGAKFSGDHLIEENKFYFLVIDGVILNKDELYGNDKEWKGRLLFEIVEERDRTLSKLRGTYYGCLIDKRTNTATLFCDHIKSKQLYYASNGKGGFVAGGTLKEVRNFLVDNGNTCGIKEKAAYHMLTYGFMLDGETIVDNIQRIPVGHYLEFSSSGHSLIKYYSFNEVDSSVLNYRDTVERCDELFRIATDRAFRKDNEYDLRHVASLSGGLDSRMTVFVAHDLGYTEQLNLTFSQSYYLDETIAHKIAIALDHEWQFRNLDGGNFFYGIDELAQLVEGNCYLFSVAHGYRMYQSLPHESTGIIHTGQIGDAVLAVSKYSEVKKDYVGHKAFSSFLKERLLEFEPEKYYESDYQHYFHNRLLNGMNAGLAGAQKYSETYSPFYDVDFLNFVLSIPEEWKFQHRLYLDWVNIKYPQAAQYVWEATGLPLNERKYKIAGRVLTKGKVKRAINKRVTNVFGTGKENGLGSEHHMNPVDYWYNTNTRFKCRLDGYFTDHIDIVENNRLRQDCIEMFTQSETIGKIQVVSLLSTIKYLLK